LWAYQTAFEDAPFVAVLADLNHVDAVFLTRIVASSQAPRVEK